MPNYDPELDYTNPEQSPSGDEADDFELAPVAAVNASAEEIEKSGSFRSIEPGDYKLVVVGFLNAPKFENREAYVNGRRRSYKSPSVIVKFGLVDDPNCQVTDFFVLPPDDPDENHVYCNGSKTDNGKSPGFMANKFYHFIENLGWPFPKGGVLPAEARRLGNWKGRTIHATVEPGNPYNDSMTGEKKPGRNQIKLFSYRPSRDTVEGRPARPSPATPSPGRRANGSSNESPNEGYYRTTGGGKISHADYDELRSSGAVAPDIEPRRNAEPARESRRVGPPAQRPDSRPTAAPATSDADLGLDNI